MQLNGKSPLDVWKRSTSFTKGFKEEKGLGSNSSLFKLCNRQCIYRDGMKSVNNCRRTTQAKVETEFSF